MEVADEGTEWLRAPVPTTQRTPGAVLKPPSLQIPLQDPTDITMAAVEARWRHGNLGIGDVMFKGPDSFTLLAIVQVAKVGINTP